jgi:ribosomal protein S18 acetylase RimI-like enzyme
MIVKKESAQYFDIPAEEITFYDEEKYVGTASITSDGFIYGIEVDLNLRGEGYGTQIIEYILNNYPDADTLTVNQENYVAINLYEKCGFRISCPFWDKTCWMWTMKRSKKN